MPASDKLDILIGKYVEIIVTDGAKVCGKLGFEDGYYKLSNVVDHRGFPANDWKFFKTHVKSIRKK